MKAGEQTIDQFSRIVSNGEFVINVHLSTKTGRQGSIQSEPGGGSDKRLYEATRYVEAVHSRDLNDSEEGRAH